MLHVASSFCQLPALLEHSTPILGYIFVRNRGLYIPVTSRADQLDYSAASNLPLHATNAPALEVSDCLFSLSYEVYAAAEYAVIRVWCGVAAARLGASIVWVPFYSHQRHVSMMI